jgi:exoribonuclease-2
VLSDEIIVFRHRGEILIGRYRSIAGHRIRAATGQNRVLEFPSDRVVYQTGVPAADAPALDRFRKRVEEGVGDLDLKEVWTLLKEEPVGYTAKDIAEFYWGARVSVEQYTALVCHLLQGCPYFSEQDGRFVPLPDERVEATLSRAASQKAAREEQEAFIRWITDAQARDSTGFTNRQTHWLQRIQQYAILGEEYDQSAQARALLQEIKGDAGGDPQRYAFSLMVHKGLWDADEHLDLIRYGVPVDFDESVMRAAEALRADEAGREDLTALPVFSIDDASTQDIDDALSLERTPDGFRIGVHIADVSAVIPRDAPLDREARRRMTSLYFPDRQIPMLPPVLSQGQCSLLQGQRRCTVSFFFSLAPDFTLYATRIVPSVIINHAKLSYEETDGILMSGDHPLTGVLQTLSDAADVFYTQRIDQGAIELERTELAIQVDAAKRIVIKLRTGHSMSEHIVSELMILTNTAAARYMAAYQIPAIYRTQEEPGVKDLEGVSHEVVRRYLILRQMKPLALSLDPKPHATLGVDMYCQITSPIRRYSDLVLQRQLTAALRGQPPCYDRDAMMDELSQLERSKELNRIWSRREWYWLLRYFAGQPNLRMAGVVLEVRERDVLIELLDYGVRATMTAVAPVAVGEEVAVRVTQADAWSGTLRLAQVLASESPDC